MQTKYKLPPRERIARLITRITERFVIAKRTGQRTDYLVARSNRLSAQYLSHRES